MSRLSTLKLSDAVVHVAVIVCRPNGRPETDTPAPEAPAVPVVTTPVDATIEAPVP